MEAGEGGIKLRPELMERERLYHCIFGGKVMLVFKDSVGVLNCYEIEEPELVERVGRCGDDAEVEAALAEYAGGIKRQN